MTPPTTHDGGSDQLIRRFAEQVRSASTESADGPLRLGVDLGTANIVLAVVDAANQPVGGAWLHSTVVRDGVVVDWQGATRAVRTLKQDLESRLSTQFEAASMSIPPGIDEGTIRVFSNVLQASGLEVAEVVDEPVAAARVLGVTDGCVIDVGHGTTGVSILADGKVVKSVDEATGGHHMTLVVAGAYGIEYDEAEAMKTDPSRQADVLGVIRPTLEKMATIAAEALVGHNPPMIHLVGGSSSFSNAPDVFAQVLHRPVVRPLEPLFVTPLGVPMTAIRAREGQVA